MLESTFGRASSDIAVEVWDKNTDALGQPKRTIHNQDEHPPPCGSREVRLLRRVAKWTPYPARATVCYPIWSSMFGWDPALDVCLSLLAEERGALEEVEESFYEG